MSKNYTMKELVEQYNVSEDTLRYYEKLNFYLLLIEKKTDIEYTKKFIKKLLK
ncbi:MerR family transcriptional regulator [Priestia endophytica]|jgi:DNA-binding transcriptional MerR regulator|uniref:MerR family transcriptional regulator n=1 Tax=Priestia endophytica TaxID=135735 RepID=UPI0035580485